MSMRGPVVHELKTWPQFFEMVLDGRKAFELRRDDRPKGFHAGDTLVLQEWSRTQGYTGRELRVRVTCCLREQTVGIRPGFVALGIERLPSP